MELLVKIGADQGALRDTVERMKQQFKSANISMPLSWQPQAQALQRYGQIIRPDLPQQVPDLAGVTAQIAIRKSTSLLKGMLIGELTSLAAEALNVLGQKFWEKVYGVNDETTARIAASHKEMRRIVEGLRGARASLDEKVFESILKHATPEKRVELLQANKAAADRQQAEAQRKFDEAQQDVYDVMSGRARVMGVDARGVPYTREATKQERQPIIFALAAADTALVKAKEKALAAEDRYQEALDAQIADQLERNRRNARPAPEAPLEKPSFQADALAQAGLFAGSSLLFNPNFTVQQQQLDVMREMNGNLVTIASRHSMFEP